MKIGVDIDGVLTNVQDWIVEVGGKYFSRYGKKIEDIIERINHHE